MGEQYTKITPQIGSGNQFRRDLLRETVEGLRVGDCVEVVLAEVAFDDEAERATLRGSVWMSGGAYLVGPITVRHEDGTPDRLVQDVTVVRPAWHDAAVIRATIISGGDGDVRGVYLLRGKGGDGQPAFLRVVEADDGVARHARWHSPEELSDVEVVR